MSTVRRVVDDDARHRLSLVLPRLRKIGDRVARPVFLFSQPQVRAVPLKLLGRGRERRPRHSPEKTAPTPGMTLVTRRQEVFYPYGHEDLDVRRAQLRRAFAAALDLANVVGFARVMVIDTGNTMRAPNWAATGHADLVADAATVLTAPARTTDPSSGAGGPIDYPALTSASPIAWLEVTAAVANKL